MVSVMRFSGVLCFSVPSPFRSVISHALSDVAVLLQVAADVD